MAKRKKATSKEMTSDEKPSAPQQHGAGSFAEAVSTMPDVAPMDRSHLSDHAPPNNPGQTPPPKGGSTAAKASRSNTAPTAKTKPAARATRSEMRQLRAGKIRPHQTIDLHGFNRDDAYRRLCNAVPRAFASGARCVLVVHGKGQNSANGQAVLRDALAIWIEEQPLISWVTGHSIAQGRDGGSGASYLLLRGFIERE
ncbi:MAG: DNA-nicking Smr family endonuclease [Myxococcota bacterium]